MYAVIETGGKQYRVQPGDVITIEKLKVADGDKVSFDKVLVVNDGTAVNVGTPVVADAVVSGTVVENGKGKKVIIYKYKAKKDYRKKQGHRQPYTMVKIEEVTLGGKVLVAEVAEEKPVEKKPAKKAAPKKEEPVVQNEEKPAETEVEVVEAVVEAAPAEAEEKVEE